MANLQISIKDENSARQWLMMVEGINQDYNAAMRDAADCLQDMQNFADGTMVDELVNFGNAMLTATERTFDTIKQIADTVNNVLNAVKNFTEDIVGGISRIAQMFG